MDTTKIPTFYRSGKKSWRSLHSGLIDNFVSMSVYRSRITSWQSAASLPHRILEILRSAISKIGSLGKTGRHYWFQSFFLLTAGHLDLILSFYICQNCLSRQHKRFCGYQRNISCEFHCVLPSAVFIHERNILFILRIISDG